jgi:hypothetical protein
VAVLTDKGELITDIPFSRLANVFAAPALVILTTFLLGGRHQRRRRRLDSDDAGTSIKMAGQGRAGQGRAGQGLARPRPRPRPRPRHRPRPFSAEPWDGSLKMAHRASGWR